VAFFVARHLAGQHERLQPQGGGNLGTGKQIRGRGGRTLGEGNRRFHQVSEQRSRASGSPRLDQSAENRVRKTRADGEISRRTREVAKVVTRVVAFLSLALLLTACGGHKQARVKVPPAPPVAKSRPEVSPVPPPFEPSAKTPEIPSAPPSIGTAPLAPDAHPIAVETGLASWYGAPYHNRHSSNGQIYDMNAMTAAHRTLPLGSIVRVTNVKTGHAAVVRITDRGPFVPGRIVDLSLAAAKKTDVWQAGLAPVRVEVLESPKPLESMGRWAVQIGAFNEETVARTMADRLSQRYRTTRVLCFSSPVGAWWVRVRVKDDDKKRAQELVRENHTPQGSIFLVRLD
jgi:rare lipoprotein A